MSKKRESKQQLFFTNQPGGAGQWTDEVEQKPAPKQVSPPHEESQPIPQDDDRYRRYDDGGYRRTGFRGGRGRSFRDRDRDIRGDDDHSHRFTTGGGDRDRDRDHYRDSREPAQIKFHRAAAQIPDVGPYNIVVSNLSTDIPLEQLDLEVGEYFEDKGCLIQDVQLNPERTVMIVLADKDSVTKALEQDHQPFKGWVMRVELQQSQAPQAYVAPAGVQSFNDHDRDRDGYGGGRDRDYGGFRRGGRGRGGYHRDGEFRRRDDYGRRDYGRRDGERTGGYRRYDRQDDRRDGGSAPAPSERPAGQKVTFTVQVQKHEKKEDPFAGIAPKDIKPQ